MFAQSLIEYGSISSSIEAAAASVRDWLSELSPSAWMVAGGVFLVALWLWTRPRRV